MVDHKTYVQYSYEEEEEGTLHCCQSMKNVLKWTLTLFTLKRMLLSIAAAVFLKNHFYALFPHSPSKKLQTSYLHTMGCKSCD